MKNGHFIISLLFAGLSVAGVNTYASARSLPATQTLTDNRVQTECQKPETKNSIGNTDNILSITSPAYKYGQDEMDRKIDENLNPPTYVYGNAPTGDVIVSIIIDKNGKIASMEIIKSLSPEIDAEVLRVMALLNEWTPSTVKGYPAPSVYHYRFSFN